MQNREPPAYQEYAATMLASRPFRLMNAGERGLLYSMRLECWANQTLPADPAKLAAILGLYPGDVANSLPAVMPFFTVENNEIKSPELDAYREHLLARHLSQSNGGKTGASITNDKRKKPRRLKNGAAQGSPAHAPTPTATSTSTPAATPTASGRLLSAAKISTAKSKSPPVKDLGAVDPWLADYNDAQAVEVEI